MEIAIVRQRVREAMEQAKRRAHERRGRTDAASRAFDIFLSSTAVPLVRQIANILRADGYLFNVFTPSGSVRLMSDKSAEDFIELTLDTTTDPPRVTSRASRTHGRRGVHSERVVGSGDPGLISEDELLTFLLQEIAPFVER